MMMMMVIVMLLMMVGDDDNDNNDNKITYAIPLTVISILINRKTAVAIQKNATLILNLVLSTETRGKIVPTTNAGFCLRTTNATRLVIVQNVCSMDLTVTKLCRAGENNACCIPCFLTFCKVTFYTFMGSAKP